MRQKMMGMLHTVKNRLSGFLLCVTLLFVSLGPSKERPMQLVLVLQQPLALLQDLPAIFEWIVLDCLFCWTTRPNDLADLRTTS
jgi:hypothetical protein